MFVPESEPNVLRYLNMAVVKRVTCPSTTSTYFVPLSAYNWGQYGAIKHGKILPWNPVVYCLIASFRAVAFWIAMELLIQIFCTFKKRTTLYFW
jgi:hypothetical protein